MNKKLEIEFRDNFNKAINEFNFSDVYRVMDFLDWRWCLCDGVPSQAIMIDEVNRIFEEILKRYEDGRIKISTGGFCVELNKNADVEISFVLASAEWNNDFNE